MATRTHTIDARGLPCPLPLVRLAEAVGALAPGTEVRLLGTDVSLKGDVAAWCAATGHRLLAISAGSGVLEARVEVTQGST